MYTFSLRVFSYDFGIFLLEKAFLQTNWGQPDADLEESPTDSPIEPKTLFTDQDEDECLAAQTAAKDWIICVYSIDVNLVVKFRIHFFLDRTWSLG